TQCGGPQAHGVSLRLGNITGADYAVWTYSTSRRHRSVDRAGVPVSLHESPQDPVMAKTVKKIPDGYTDVTPYLIIKGAAEALEFYKKAFGAEEGFRMNGPEGKIAQTD